MSGILQGVLASIGGAQATYIEDVFSTWLTTGAGSNITVNNGIDLAGKGGLVWNKTRNTSGFHTLFDTARGVNNGLFSNATNAQTFSSNWLPTFNSNGFVIGTDNNLTTNGTTGVSWTFRKQPKFFDVVTYTGDGSDSRQLAHNLETSPAFIIIKCTSNAEDWIVGARNNNNNFENLRLNTTAASPGSFGAYPTGSAFVSSTTVGVGWWAMAGQATLNQVNASGRTYVAYLFAHNAGGFGLSGNENVISCGSFTTDGSGSATVSLGYEPQYLMIKASSTAQNWFTFDVMRGWSLTGQQVLRPNLSDAEFAAGWGNPTATGFYFNTAGLTPSATYIYMAIRRGPMATSTLGTSVFYPTTYTETVAQGTAYTGGFPVDSLFTKTRNAAFSTAVFDRLRGTTTADNNILFTALTDAETDYGIASWNFANNTGVNIGELSNNTPSRTDVIYQFRRAPGFFDQVCYEGTGSVATQTHNLGVAPEMMIIKCRNTASTSWVCYHIGVNGGVNPQNYYMLLQSNQAQVALTAMFNDTAPTSSVFTIGAQGSVGASGRTYVAYLFATVAGVSKVGSYTGTGGTQTINAGLPTGARFVLIKRTDSTGDWWVWDTARGMVAGTDPRFAFNAQTTETNNDWVYTTTNGFQIVTSDATVNASGGSYIYLAIA